MRRLSTTLLPALLMAVALLSLASGAMAQDEDAIKENLAKGAALMDQGKYLEAEPYIEKLVQLDPNDSDYRAMYGALLFIKSKTVTDKAVAESAAKGALEQLKAAKKLGTTVAEVDTMIAALGGDPGTPAAGTAASASPYDQAEVKFAQGKYEEALALYKKALDADPKNYLAALYSADSLMELQRYDEAEVYYKKAIEIGPSRETAYRYSATYLMKQKKYDLARDRYIEAYITEPYNAMSSRGISQWAGVTGKRLGHPNIAVPKLEFDAAGKAQLTMSAGSKPEAAKLWNEYATVRTSWHGEKFAKAFPAAKGYRHSLAEEVAALKSVLAAAAAQKVTDTGLDILSSIDKDGMLEAYVLLSIPDEGISNDYDAYLTANRPKLRAYVVKYIIHD